MHSFLLHNEEIEESGSRSLGAGQVGLLSGWGVFSTLRVYDGVPFEWERHWERMCIDAAKLRVPMPADRDAVRENLLRLIDANQAWNSTLRVYVVRNKGGLYEGPGQTRDCDVIAFTIDVVHWKDTVNLGIVPNGRYSANEFAGVKQISWAENLTRYERAKEQGFDEVILLNEREEVAECTSANIFVVNGSRVWTPPLSSGCLPGVTRAIMLEQIELPGIEIEEKELTVEDLEIADEVLVTSSTRELLPAVSIEGLQIPGGHEVCDALRETFLKYVEKYKASRRHAVPVTK